MLRQDRLFALICATTAAVAIPGCDSLFDLGEDSTSLVQVMVTHHATPKDGQFPDTATALGNRAFDTDEGWRVTLTDAYVVTADIALQSCGGGNIPLEQYWGPLPEDLGSVDLDLFTFGGAELAPGSYCGVTVTYGPYAPSDAERRELAMPPTAGDLDGATFYLAGYAERGDMMVPFELRSEERLVIALPIQAQDGGPMVVKGDESFPLELTLSKTYDRLFDGVDFSVTPVADLEANALAVFGVETRVSPGTAIAPH